jgi:hypothetical protein
LLIQAGSIRPAATTTDERAIIIATAEEGPPVQEPVRLELQAEMVDPSPTVPPREPLEQRPFALAIRAIRVGLIEMVTA